MSDAGQADALQEGTLRFACAELDRRLRAGEGYRVEQLLADRPLLAACEDAAVELIYTEFVTREELGQRPTPEEFCTRFPAWRERLRRQFQVHRLFREHLGADLSARSAEPPEDGGVPHWLGGYELLEELGRGTGGVVYRARQGSLGRLVALKVLRPEQGRKPRLRRRFWREARVLAALRHPHIIAVHDLGEHHGWLYYSMDLAEGGSLARLAMPLAPRTAAALLEDVAWAVDHAHQHGIVHCDLKPSNVLLDRDGQPLLGDFGLAWVPVEGGSLRRGLAGTPAYMAPEQLEPGGTVSPATDLWALGVILYEMLAGQRPFTGRTLDELHHAVHQAEPPPLDGPAATLEAVWRRCLAREPAQRFASAAALAAALRRFRT